MPQILFSDKKYKKFYYVDDIKSNLILNRYFSYSKNINIKNNHLENIVFYNKKIINNSFKYILKNNKNVKDIPKKILEPCIIESFLFTNFTVDKFLFYKRVDKSIITISNNNLNYIKDSYIFYFTLKDKFPGLKFQKLNDNVCSIKIVTNADISSFSYSDFKNNYFEINQAIKNGSDLLLVEKDYFSFTPCFKLSKLFKNYKYYFQTFECSYFYYTNPISMEIISNYYSKLNDIIRLYKQNKNNPNLIFKLENLNNNTHILLKQNKLL